jgi:hypothetical protein
MAHEAAYRIHVAGSPDPQLAEWFEILAVERGAGGDFVLVTPSIDQAELRGLLSALFNMNVRVLAVVPRAAEAGDAPEA